MNTAHRVFTGTKPPWSCINLISKRQKNKTKPSCPSSHHSFKPILFPFYFFFQDVFFPVMKNMQVLISCVPLHLCKLETDMLPVSRLKRCNKQPSSLAIIPFHKDASSLYVFSILSLSISQFTAYLPHKTLLIFCIYSSFQVN